MHTRQDHQPPLSTYVSTGHLPQGARVQTLLQDAFERYRADRSGANSQVYPALARAPADRFGICVTSPDGTVCSVGDADEQFTIMSVSKPFVFALVCQHLGPQQAREHLGVNSTGLPFNSVAAIERTPDGRTNPMVNPGAIATTSLVPGASEAERWAAIREGLSRFAGHTLSVDEEIYASATATNSVNRGIAWMLHSRGRINGDPLVATDLYTRQCSLKVTARDLSVMGATLACGGVNPVTGARVVDPSVCHYTLAVMLTAGLYETSGEWLYDVGLPGKSGIGGGIVAVAPGKGGLGTYAPRLDAAGNSVKGQLVAKYLAQTAGLDLLASAPRL
ncbi:MAG: glutaminase A [Chloroflexi bacterium]|nr:glutaminase A [Chloroflexota bacterium]